MQKFAIAFIAAAVVASAGSAIAQDYRIAFGDLDLATAEGAAQFDRRVTRAARSACNGIAPLAASSCFVRFRAEARSLLPTDRREDYARARSGRVLAMVPVIYG